MTRPTAPAPNGSTPIADPRDTLRTALRHLESVQAQRRLWALAEAQRAVAAAYREVGALPSALAMLDSAMRWARASGQGDLLVELMCEAVETLAGESDQLEREERGSGRPSRERARDLVFDATQRVARVADPRWEVTVLLRLSDVLDRFGDRDDATQLQVRALQITVGSAAPSPMAADGASQRRH